MLLDPRHWRLDDLLRRPLRDGDPLGGEAGLHGAVAPGWGFAGALRAPGAEPFAPFTLHLTADGEPVAPGDGIYRPSHITRHGRAADAGLQVVEDAFLADDTAVSVLWVRNPTDASLSVDIRLRWGIRAGEHPFGAVCRMAPPGDDLSVRLPAGGRGRLPFVVALGPDPESARRRAERWFAAPNPPIERAAELQAHFARAAARFDCDDPYLTRLWYHRWERSLQERAPAPMPAADADPRRSFERGEYDRPAADAPAWERHVLERLVGWRSDESTLRLSPDPSAGGLRHFCLDNLPWGERRVSVVWDDPRGPVDVYDDGDRGFTVYVDRRRVFHAEDAPSSVVWEPEDEGDYFR